MTVNASILPVAGYGNRCRRHRLDADPNVAANDTVNGTAAALGSAGNATVAQSGAWPAGIALNTATGAIANTTAVAPGSYGVVYQLCDRTSRRTARRSRTR